MMYGCVSIGAGLLCKATLPWIYARLSERSLLTLQNRRTPSLCKICVMRFGRY